MVKIDLLKGHEFIADPGVTLLDAASRAGISFPYSCRTGRCSTCKALVLRGQTRPLSKEFGLSLEELDAGWILTCVRSAETDVQIDIDDLGAIKLSTPKTLPCRIAGLERLTSDVMQVKIRLHPTTSFSFIPGQYIDLIGPNGIRRSYSLANASSYENILELHVRAVHNGSMSNYWFNDAKVNDLLRLHGPLGTFILRDFENSDIFFLATGTGIAPIKSMLESLIYLPVNQQPSSITVLWGGRNPKDFYIDIEAIPGKHRFIPVVSRPVENWMGAKGYVQDVVISKRNDFKKSFVYACGSEKMIRDAKKLLLSNGLPLSNFYSDAFVSSGSTIQSQGRI